LRQMMAVKTLVEPQTEISVPCCRITTTLLPLPVAA
jgi:hypothetical protein